QEGLGRGGPPNQIVVDEEHVGYSERPKRIELALDLLDGLAARLAAEHDDDVAEFAEKGATARKLHGRGRVSVQLQQVEARDWRIGQSHDTALAIEASRAAAFEIRTEARPDVLGFAGYDRVGDQGVTLRAQRCEAAASHHIIASSV